jgi:outer membrane protein assembly factor BamB
MLDSRFLASVGALCLMSFAVRADDWPQFRGPNRDGVSRETGWLTQWPPTGLKVLWKQPVGRGYSNVAVAKGRVFTIGLLPKDESKKNVLEETVTCLEEATGKVLWRFSYPGFQDKSFPGSRSTPTADGNVLYVYGQHGGLYCLECESGKVIWQKLMGKDLGAQNVTYGYAASPLLVGDMVVVPARILENMAPKDSTVKPSSNALLLAFDKGTGEEIWRMYHESYHLGGGYYACPTACVMNGKPVLVYHTGNACLGLEPTTGKTLWKHAFSDADLLVKQGRHGITAQEPAVLGNRIVCCVHPDNSNGLGVCLEVEGDQVKEVWRDKLLDNYSCNYIVWKGHVFGIQHNDTTSRIGPLYCFDIATGKKKWEQREAGGSFTMIDGKFLTFTGEELVLIEASTEKYLEIARSQKLFAPSELTFRYSDRIAPVLANGRVYCRSQNGILICLDVRGKGER